MTLEQYASIAEIVGVAIVVVTFIFLAIQLRQGTRALKAGTVQNLQNQTMTVYGMLLEDMDVFMKGMEDPLSLSTLDRAKFNALMTVNFHALQNAYFQIQSGAYDGRMQEGWWQVMRNNFLSPGYVRYWERRKFMLDPGFCKFVETEVMKRNPTQEYAKRVSD
jgi:hypothetical protein